MGAEPAGVVYTIPPLDGGGACAGGQRVSSGGMAGPAEILSGREQCCCRERDPRGLSDRDGEPGSCQGVQLARMGNRGLTNPRSPSSPRKTRNLGGPETTGSKAGAEKQ